MNRMVLALIMNAPQLSLCIIKDKDSTPISLIAASNHNSLHSYQLFEFFDLFLDILFETIVIG